MMGRWTKAFTVVLLGALLLPTHVPAARTPKRTGFVTIAFDGDCEGLIADQIQSARRELLVAIYVMTSARITRLIITAHQRNVNVRIKYDVEQAKYSSMQKVIAEFEKRGIECVPITLKRSGASMHNKFIVIDGLRVITGSYNYTAMAHAHNYENCLLIESQQAAQDFAAVFDAIVDR